MSEYIPLGVIIGCRVCGKEFPLLSSEKVDGEWVRSPEGESIAKNGCCISCSSVFSAVYQKGYAIFGVGKNDDEAIKDACQWVGNEELNIVNKSQAVVGDMVLIKISKSLYDEVKRKGGVIAFEECDDGIYRLESEVI